MSQNTRDMDQEEFEDLSSYSSSEDRGRRRQKTKRPFTGVQIAVILVSVLLILMGGAMIYISTDLLAGLTTNIITKDTEELGIDAAAVLDDSVTNIALFGVDARNDDFTGASDVVMILTVDNKHRKLKMTSILRDSKVHIEGQTLNGESIDWLTKINAAYEEGGPELAIRTLNTNFSPERSSLNIRGYVTVNFANMAAIVDAFGGLDMELTAEEAREINRNLWSLSQEVLDQMEVDKFEGTYAQKHYPFIVREDFIFDPGTELDIEGGNYTGGTYHLNGNRAVAYGRIRHLGDDYARVSRQQRLFNLLIQRLLEMGVTDYPGLIRQLMPYCETSLELSDIVKLTPILFSDFTIESISVPNIAYETDLYDGLAEDGIAYAEYALLPAAQRISSFIYEEDSPYWETFGNTGTAPQGAAN